MGLVYEHLAVLFLDGDGLLFMLGPFAYPSLGRLSALPPIRRPCHGYILE